MAHKGKYPGPGRPSAAAKAKGHAKPAAKKKK